MLGLIVSACYFLYLAFIGGDMSTEAAFLQASGLLYSWYWVVSIIFAFVLGVFALLMILGVGVAGSAGGGLAFGVIGAAVGGVGGMTAGGLLMALSLAGFVVRCAFLIGGAYLLMTAGSADMAFADFEMWRIGVGAALIFLGIILRDSSRSSDD